MSGAHYEAEVERNGVYVRVIVDVTPEAAAAYGDDMDETGEAVGAESTRILRTVLARGEKAPF